MHPTMRTGRALKLDEIVNSRNKVTLGFKCSPQLKISLAQEAQGFSMSLSEYVEAIVENRNAQSQAQQLNQGNNAEVEVWQLNAQIKELTRKLLFYYEEPMMKQAFQTYKGQIVPYTDRDGIPRWDAITTMEDVYKILFKTNKFS